MAVEQDFLGYTDQAHLKTTDVGLFSTSGGAGVNVTGDNIVARRPDGIAGIDAVIYSALSGRAGYRLYNGGAVSEWFIGQISNAEHHLRFQTLVGSTYTTRLTLETSGNLASGVDNSGNALGLPSLRWSVVYAATGTINTSDEREKEWRGRLTDAELRAARRIAAELGFYRWLNAIAEKGEAARLHFGARAQAVWRIMADEGLVDPIGDDGLPGSTTYAFLCFDQWEEIPAIPAQPAQLGPDGEILSPEVAEVPARPAGNRFGLRVDQLALFLIAAQEQRLLALESRA